MKKEKSCGAVLYKKVNGVKYYLCLHMSLGHYSICKGHVEGNETEKETALREIKEETSLEALIDTNFREVITYSPYKDCIKDVVFFVGEIVNGKEKPQEEEVSEISYLTLKDMLKTLTYDSDKEVVKKADLYLKRKGI